MGKENSPIKILFILETSTRISLMVKELLNGNPVRCILEIGKMIFLVDKGYSKPNVRKVKLNMMVNLLATLRK